MLRNMGQKTVELFQTKPEFFCLLFLLGLDFLLMAFGNYGLYFIDNYTIMPCMLFLGILMGRRLSPAARRTVLVGMAFSLWFLATQMIHFATDLSSRPLGGFLSVFLLALPFASASEDEQEQLGLKMAGFAYIGAALVLALLAGLLLLDAVPGFLRYHVFWFRTRLYAMAHPNICASIFMIGCGFSLAFAGLWKNKWLKTVSLAAYFLFLGLMVLTNSRTTILMTLAMTGCFAFFAVFRRGNRKRLLAAILAMVLTAGVLLIGTNGLRDVHMDWMESQAAEQETAVPEEVPSAGGQGTFQEDIWTLNGRTTIWASVIQALVDEPTRLVWGTDVSEKLLITYPPYRLEHAHNAWLETALCMGIPGLIFALFFTALAVWGITGILFCDRYDLWQKGICLIVLFLMGTAVLEPYLFMTDRYYHYANMLFFLLLGYLVRWRKTA